MKKKLFALLLIAAAGALSCSKEPAQSTDSGKSHSGITEFRATIEEDVKTSLCDSTRAVSWKLGDEIAVIDEAGTVFKFVAQSAGTRVSFTKAKDQGELSGSTFYAVYPYSDSLAWDNATKTASVETKAARVVSPGDFGGAYDAVMTACTTDDELHFKNLSCILKFTVPDGLNVQYLYLYAGGGSLAGKFGVTIGSDGTPAVSAKPATAQGITLSTDSTAFAPGTYYIPVMPAEYTSLRCKMTYDDKSVSEAFSLNALSARRNEITSIGTLYDCRSWYKWLTFENGAVPASIIEKAGTVTIIDNPVKGKANPSSKIYQCSVSSGTSSGYITIDLSKISSNIRKNIKGLKFQMIPTTGNSLPYYTFVKCAKNGGKLESGVLPGTINGKTCTSQAEYKACITYGGWWNTFEYKASLFGVDNFETITKLQIRQSQYYGSESNVSAPFSVQIDNIGFTYE